MLSKIKSLFSNKGFVKYFKNTSWLFAEKILRMFVGLFVGIWIARYLGPEQFGLFSYAQSFVGLFIAIATLGLDGIVVKELVEDPKSSKRLIGTVFWLKFFGAILVLLILAAAVHFTSNDHFTNILIFIIASATIFQSFNVVDFYFQSKVMSKYIVMANSFVLLVSSLIKIFLIIKEAPLEAFAWMILFDSFILALTYIYLYLKLRCPISFFRFDRALAVRLLKSSWPLILSSIAISVYMKIDQVMIKEMLDSEAVGQYAAAVRISEAWYFIPMVISASLFPAIINAKKTSEKLYYDRLQKLYFLMVWMAVAIAVPMTFLSHWIVEFLYGAQYDQAANVLMIHIWAAVFVFLLSASGKWYILENYTKLALYRNIIGAIVNIILNYYLIPIYGIMGAAVATLISYAIAGFFYDFINKCTRETFYIKLNSICFCLKIKNLYSK